MGIKIFGINKALSTWFQTVNSTFLTRMWDISPCDFTTSGNMHSKMSYRWHHCRLCFGCIQAFCCCSYCTIIAGERSHSAWASFRTDCWWCYLHTGDDLSISQHILSEGRVDSQQNAQVQLGTQIFRLFQRKSGLWIQVFLLSTRCVLPSNSQITELGTSLFT